MGEEEGTVRLGVRLPTSVHRRLQERARENHRSLNAEIVAAVNNSLTADQSVGQRIQEIEERYKTLVTSLEETKIEVRRVRDETFSDIPVETRDLMTKVARLSVSRGKTFADLLGEALRKMLNEEVPE